MNTISETIIIAGIGIHSGKEVTMEITPTTEKGIYFEFNDHLIQVDIKNIAANHLRSTILTNRTVKIQTPEHFLAACYAMELTNIKVKLSSYELPIMDGSAINFIEFIQPFIVSLPNIKRSLTVISENIHFSHNDSHYFLFPAPNLRVTIALSYPNHWLKSMIYSFNYTKKAFIDEICPARTYGFTHEIEQLKKQDLIKGGSLDNAILISDEGYVNELRFDNEIIRHKLLDFFGDFYISGSYLQANCVLIKPSHEGNCGLLKELKSQRII